ncbi:hypothetical protein DL240_13865 [Lujinxingia litoralis]|uniref:TonB-dependent receptor n=1 Tax=Lujinxingia litoralis TaxID=2211119 RepID=A0A328C497_9DELT|nr:TonB-dependent receptor [Lujinxingia litoralis]RAL21214.1 hypothetical protein DL240_13865 [Lujinxingia litoralis]
MAVFRSMFPRCVMVTLLAAPGVASAESVPEGEDVVATSPEEGLTSEDEQRGSEASGEVETIASVTVSGRRAQPEFEAERSVSVIDEAELAARQSVSLGEALSEEPGVSLQATTRGSETVYVRGLVGPENLILVDGVRFNQSTFRTGPNQYLATLSPGALARVELLRGPGSVLYGSGAMGGVIELQPEAIPTQGSDIRVTLRGRTADLGRGFDLRGGWGTSKVGAMAGATMMSHDRLSVGSRGGEGIFLAAESEGEMLASDYEQRFYQGGMRLADEAGKTELELRYLHGAIEGAKRTDQLGLGQMREIDNSDDLVWATFRRDELGPLSELEVFGAYHRTDEQTARVKCTFGDDVPPSDELLRRCASLDDSLIGSRRRLRDTVQTFGGGFRVELFPAERLRVLAGGEGYFDAVASRREDAAGGGGEFVLAARGNFADGSTYSTLGGYAHGEFSLWSDGARELVANGGARVEHARAFAPGVNATLGDVSFANTGVVGQLGLNLLVGQRYNIYANWSQGFRSPNLQETTVLGDTGNFFEVPNDELGPERSDTFEVGLKSRLPYLGQLRAGVFASLISDRITGVDGTYQGQSEVDGKQVRVRVNADQAYYYGLEAGLRSEAFFGVSLYGNLALIDGAVEASEPDASFEGGPLHGLFAGDRDWTTPRRLPPMQYLVGLSYSPLPEVQAALFVQGAGAQERLSSGDRRDYRICEVAPGQLAAEVGQECGGTPGWATLNLRASYRPLPLLELDLALTNLSDERYQHHGSGMLGAGRQALLSATLGF